MQTYFDCYPCFLRQAINAARGVGADYQSLSSVTQRVLTTLQSIQLHQTPPEIAYQVHQIVRDTVAVRDPYHKVKQSSTEEALQLYPRLKHLVADSDDALDTAIRISIAGNIIDFGVQDRIQSLWHKLERVLSQPFAIDHLSNLRSMLRTADSVLFLGDNAGETVFDRILTEIIEQPIIYVVKGGPVLNDATMDDAIAAGLDQSTTLISNGTQAPGTILSLCSDEFLQQYEAAPLIIAKGQANYETLSEAGSKVFCLLQVKCPVIARDIGAPVDSIVVRQSL